MGTNFHRQMPKMPQIPQIPQMPQMPQIPPGASSPSDPPNIDTSAYEEAMRAQLTELQKEGVPTSNQPATGNSNKKDLADRVPNISKPADGWAKPDGITLPYGPI
ncbi:hypothetical protein [Actimicrobium sp. CCI2.3]|uniref:hypothetical protein n=1 Tax=Actimicrobium sp. CCI2.3 TaxID=3048616 RepID=UPI002AB55BBE|nr:hypothetical protein [Actimicrobium sp. CCI2.3]MDY7574549.1 hypothetical protein [Actimicrobium sp. CCI2.3]MEB0020925.1 hypothetical protein [Actimicrobium sp. CCI2.3]